MLKRFIGGVLAWIMVINMAIILLPEQSVYAFNNYQVKATVNTTVRADGDCRPQNMERHLSGISGHS